MAAIRVYDPRGFEFEIGVENLLYILQECTSTKGKGLEGEFVYAWDKSDLVLLPVSSQEYVSCRAFTDGLSKKVSKADMKEGCVYITKKQEEVIYLGKQQWFDGDTYSGETLYNYEDKGERHVFAYVGKRDTYEPKWYCDTGFTKLASKVSDVISTEYAEKFEEFKKSLEGAGIKSLHLVGAGNDHSWEYVGRYDKFIVKEGEDYYKVQFQSDDGYGYYNRSTYSKYTMVATAKVIINGNSVVYDKCDKALKVITLGQMKELGLYKLTGKLHNNKTVSIQF
jgi:hypothetical protein